MSIQLDVGTNDNLLGSVSNHSINVYQGRYANNFGLNGCYASAPNLNESNLSISSLQEEEEYNRDIAQSELKLNHIPLHVVASDSTASPRLRRARNKLTSLLSIKMANDASIENEGRSPKPPRVRTPSLFRKMGLFGENNVEQNSKSYLKVEQNGLLKSQLKKSVSFPTQSLQDISTCGRYSPRHRMPFSGAMFMNKIPNEDEVKEIFNEMIRYIQTDDCKSLKSIIKRKLVDINTILDDSSSLLHEASYKGCIKCIKTIIKNGCSINICDVSGWTSLHASIFAKKFDAVKFLIENNAPVNQLSLKGWTPLHLAVFVGDLYIVHELIKNGGDPLRCNDKNISPFQLAINLRKSLILDYFLQLPCFLVDT